jgi:endonuclease III
MDKTIQMELSERAAAIHERLLDHFGEAGWRESLPPLDELVSTILSQNTNDTNRDRAFESLKNRLPTWEAVRDAPEEEVIEAIKVAGLGNQKGPRIQAVLKDITKERGSLDLGFLKDMTDQEAYDWLVQFKGVGPKTAAIVLLFSLEKSAFPVDTHIYRVTGRTGLRPEKMNVEKAHPHLSALFSPDSYWDAHLNIIKLGREVCQARRPLCPKCPITELCDYYAAHYVNLEGEER